MSQGGRYDPDKDICIIDNKKYYETDRNTCENNGDSWERLGDFYACRERTIDEFCSNKGYPKLYKCYEKVKLPERKISQAIDKGEDLYTLYRKQHLSPQQIDRAIDKGEDLDDLYSFQRLSPQQIDKAIEKGKDLYFLYRKQHLSPQQIDKAIEKGKHLGPLYYYQTLPPQQIDKAIDKGKYLHVLYSEQRLSPQQMDKAIEKGEHIDVLLEHQKVPKHIIKKIDLKTIKDKITRGKILAKYIDVLSPCPKDDIKCNDKFCFDTVETDLHKKYPYGMRKDPYKITNVYDVEYEPKGIAVEKYMKDMEKIIRRIEPQHTIFKGEPAILTYEIMPHTFPVRVYKRYVTPKKRKILYEKDVPVEKILKDIKDEKIKKELQRLLTKKPSAKPRKMKLVVSNNPWDIMRASTCQFWSSCTSLPTGSEASSIPKYIEHGSYIAYLVDKPTDFRWHARALLHDCTSKGSCFSIQPTYGNPAYAEILDTKVKEILKSRNLNKNCPEECEYAPYYVDTVKIPKLF